MVATILALFALLLPNGRHVNRWEVVKPYNQKLEHIAWCESRQRWYIATGNSFFGGLQFTLRTWYAAGGRGYPHQNSKLEQKYRAVIWHNRIGTWVTTMGWPHCGYA